MSRVRERAATYNDILSLPEHLVGEIVGGELFVNPRPAPAHALAATSLAGEIGPPFHHGRGGPGGWWIVFEPELHIGRDIMVPDLAGWRRERMPLFPEEPFFEIEPDWVCEITSPSRTRLDRVRKLPLYAKYAVRHAWIIDPKERTLEVYEESNGRYSLISTHSNDDLVRAAPFDAIEIPLAALWIPTPPDPQS